MTAMLPYHKRHSADKVALLQPLTDKELSQVCSTILEDSCLNPLGSTTEQDARTWGKKMRNRWALL